MEYEQLKRLIREYYPFPIAHMYKKMLGVFDRRRLLLPVAAALMFVALIVGNVFGCQPYKACQ